MTDELAAQVRPDYVAHAESQLLDLLRCGQSMPREGGGSGPYSVLVSRAEQRLSAELWAFSFDSPMPTVPVALRSPSPDAHLELQQFLHDVYDSGTFAEEITE